MENEPKLVKGETEAVSLMPSLEVGYYTKTSRKVGDFFSGFFGIISFYGIFYLLLLYLFKLVPYAAKSMDYIMPILAWILPIVTFILLPIKFFRIGRKFIAIGMLSIIILILLVFGGCLLNNLF